MFRSAFVAALAAGACFAGSGVSSAFATPATGLAPHRAVYDLKLKDATERSGIAGMYGRMVYEFNGSPCDGYTVSFRFDGEGRLFFVDADGNDLVRFSNAG